MNSMRTSRQSIVMGQWMDECVIVSRGLTKELRSMAEMVADIGAAGREARAGQDLISSFSQFAS